MPRSNLLQSTRKYEWEINHNYVIKYSCQLFEECVGHLTDIKYLKQRFELGVAEELLNDYAGYEGSEEFFSNYYNKTKH